MTIVIDAALCLKKKFTKATCTACMDVCPAKSINESLEIDKSCTNCGLCLANCPVEAIAGNSYGIEPIQQLISKETPILLSCQKCQHFIDNQTTFKSIIINNSCNACGLCAKICSKEAIMSVLEDGTLGISHNPARCNNCGVCAAKCPREAISISSAKHLDKNLVLRACLPVCTNCGESYQPIGNNSLCIDCMQKIKLRSLSEQV